MNKGNVVVNAGVEVSHSFKQEDRNVMFILTAKTDVRSGIVPLMHAVKLTCEKLLKEIGQQDSLIEANCTELDEVPLKQDMN